MEWFKEVFNITPQDCWNFFWDKIIFIILLLIGLRIIKFTINKLNAYLSTKNVDKGIVGFTLSLTKYALYTILVLQVLEKIGVETTGFVAAFASISFAIGLALQGSFANFAGGVLILLLRPFKVGDYINGDGHSGTVDEISIFYTYLLTVDNKRIMIPNGSLSNHSIVNYTSMAKRRVDLEFGVGYESNHKDVKNAILRVIDKHELILDNPEPFVRLGSHGDSALVYIVRVWAKKEHYWDVHFDLLEQVKEEFDKENISIPYPHIQVVK
jgi:small conductance mechanosensitive channel